MITARMSQLTDLSISESWAVGRPSGKPSCLPHARAREVGFTRNSEPLVVSGRQGARQESRGPVVIDASIPAWPAGSAHTGAYGHERPARAPHPQVPVVRLQVHPRRGRPAVLQLDLRWHPERGLAALRGAADRPPGRPPVTAPPTRPPLPRQLAVSQVEMPT